MVTVCGWLRRHFILSNPRPPALRLIATETYKQQFYLKSTYVNSRSGGGSALELLTRSHQTGAGDPTSRVNRQKTECLGAWAPPVHDAGADGIDIIYPGKPGWSVDMEKTEITAPELTTHVASPTSHPPETSWLKMVRKPRAHELA